MLRSVNRLEVKVIVIVVKALCVNHSIFPDILKETNIYLLIFIQRNEIKNRHPRSKVCCKVHIAVAALGKRFR